MVSSFPAIEHRLSFQVVLVVLVILVIKFSLCFTDLTFVNMSLSKEAISQGQGSGLTRIRADKVSATAPDGSAGSTGSPGGSSYTTATIPADMFSPEDMAMATTEMELFFSTYDNTLRVRIDTLLEVQRALEGLLHTTQQELFKAFASWVEAQGLDWRNTSTSNFPDFSYSDLTSMVAAMATPSDMDLFSQQPVLTPGYPVNLARRPPAAAAASATTTTATTRPSKMPAERPAGRKPAKMPAPDYVSTDSTDNTDSHSDPVPAINRH